MYNHEESLSENCPVCGRRQESGDRYCKFCGTLLEENNENEGGWEIVQIVSTVIEAELMAGRLRSHGIPAIVLSQVDSTRGFTVGGLAIAKIFVPITELHRASEILSTDADESDFDSEDFDI